MATMQQTIERSDVHVELLPSTEVMKDIGDLKLKHGAKDQVLVPQPSLDPNDPLKAATMINVVMYTYFSCWASLGISSFTFIIAEEYSVSLTQVSLLTGALILTLAYANLIIVPVAANYGRRPIFFWSNVLCFVCCIWQAKANSYASFMAARIFDGIGAAANETLGPMLVADMFFLHERGFWNGTYFFALFSSCAMGPIIGGYMASSAAGWRWLFWLCAIIHGVLTITTYFFLPETKYDRQGNQVLPTHPSTGMAIPSNVVEKALKPEHVEIDEASPNILHRGYPSKTQKYGLFPQKDPLTSNVKGAWIPVSLLRFPIIVWGSAVLAFRASSFLQVSLLEGQVYGYAPYLWSAAKIGNANWALAIGTTIGFFTAGPFSDWISNWSTKRSGGIREPEMRLPALIPYAILLAIGNALLTTGWTEHWDWKPVIIVGFTCIGIELVAIATIAITYAVDCYKPVAGEILVIATVVKNTYGFGMTFFINGWAASSGYQIMWLIPGITLLLNVLAIPLYFYGKTLRRWSKDADVHRHHE